MLMARPWCSVIGSSSVVRVSIPLFRRAGIAQVAEDFDNERVVLGWEPLAVIRDGLEQELGPVAGLYAIA